ncbi:(2Fe-2S)-binding protein [bacterium]|nr:(2Fe-2S)-binding protein [bacterium]
MKIKIKINNKEIVCWRGQTILEVAKENGIFIPSLCYHPDFPARANCRICVVEIAGRKRLVTSCSTEVEEGMEIFTDSDRVKKSRNLNIELIFAEHIEKCSDCVSRYNCRLLNYAEKYKILISVFKDRKSKRKTYKFANAVEIDGTQCIDCRNCMDACSVLQNINYLELKGKGINQEIVPTKNKKIDCIYCGQCAVHCPVAAAQEQTQWEEVEEVIKNEKKIVVAQIAPAVRVSIGEEFGLPHGEIITGQVVAGLKKLGFDYVFDVNFSADVTTMVEAEELLERVKVGGVMPMMTSCCPAWVKYVEFYHPELIPNLTTARSPHIHGGGIIKNYWAKKMGIKAKNISVVSIMPCTAKKFEASRKELKVKGLFPVDFVLTVREFAFMLKKNKINLADLKKREADNPLGEYSGAAAIYGASGGVMESALRTARFMACRSGSDRNNLREVKLEFKDMRGMKNIKEASAEVAGKKLKVAAVNGIGHIEKVIENLNRYDYVEVMACPGGCIGGGGQPIPTTDAIRKKRIAALYKIDKGKKLRSAHENKGVLKVLKWLKGQGRLEHQILHTKYRKRN